VGDRLHVLLVSAWYPAPDEPVGGLFVRDQARAACLHCDVTVLARATPDTPRESREDGLRVLRVLPATGAGLMVNIRRLAAMDAAVRQLRREAHPPDVVHGHVYYAAFLAVLLGRLHRLSVVVSEHYTGFLGGRLSLFHKAVARITFRYATLVCPVSAMLEQSLVRLEPQGRYTVVPETVDVEAFAAEVRPARGLSGPRLLTVAGLFAKKGLPDLLEALRLLLRDHPNSRLEIVGGGPDREALESAAVGLPVTFLGERSREHVAALMSEADVLVMPSLVETFGIAPLEALAAGLAVVATTAFPVADIIADLGGVIVPPADPRALCAAVASVLAGQAPVRPDAAAEIRRRFGLEATGRQWEAIYRSVVDGSS
jgi:glycosyltransferase involved in cell wall biosynthesis